MEVAQHSLRFLTSYFGIPYPGGKLDHVAVPDLLRSEAMKNLGCAVYLERGCSWPRPTPQRRSFSASPR